MTSNDRPNLAALGYIVTSYSRLEWLVSGFIGRLLSADGRVGSTITAGMPISQKLTLLGNLFRLVAEYDRAAGVRALDEAIRIADKAVERRNSVTHTTWWTADKRTGELVRLKPQARRGRGFEWKQESASVAALVSVAVDLDHAFNSLSDVMATHFERASGSKGVWDPPDGEGTLWNPTIRARSRARWSSAKRGRTDA